jgi:uncharacterized membrane protein YfcA
MIDAATILSILLAFGSFSLVESYLRALAGDEQVWLVALSASGACALLGYLAQIYVGVNAIVAAFSLSIAFTAAWLMLKGRGGGRWQGRARR